MKRLRLDYHEGLSDNQVRIALYELGLDYKDFAEWMNGQTCPIVPRPRELDGEVQNVPGVYEYDLVRYVHWKLKGIKPIWD